MTNRFPYNLYYIILQNWNVSENHGRLIPRKWYKDIWYGIYLYLYIMQVLTVPVYLTTIQYYNIPLEKSTQVLYVFGRIYSRKGLQERVVTMGSGRTQGRFAMDTMVYIIDAFVRSSVHFIRVCMYTEAVIIVYKREREVVGYDERRRGGQKLQSRTVICT